MLVNYGNRVVGADGPIFKSEVLVNITVPLADFFNVLLLSICQEVL